MTLGAAFSLTRSRRLRPETYSRVSGALIAFFLIVLMARAGANFYLAQFLAASQAGRDTQSVPVGLFALWNVAWCFLFLSTVAPLVAYRGIARTARSPRLGYFPLSVRHILTAAVTSSVTGAVAIVPVLLSGLAAALGLRGPLAFLYFAVVFASGLTGFLLVEAVAWKCRTAEEHLELIEAALLALMILANPDFRLTGAATGVPQITLFMHWKFGPEDGPLLLLLPLAGTVVALAAILAARLFGGMRMRRRGRSARRPGLVLYRTRIPVGLFAATYAVEIPVILTNPGLTTSVRGLVITLLVVRVLWFLAFLFRTEQEIGSVIRGPQRFRLRLPVYRGAALVHLLLCAFPVVLYVIRSILDRAGAS